MVFIRANLVESVIRCVAAMHSRQSGNCSMYHCHRSPPAVCSQLLESARSIVYSDFPESWPSLMDQIYANLNTQVSANIEMQICQFTGFDHHYQDQQRILGALGLLRTVVRKFEFKDESQRAPLETIVQGTFPLLLQIMQALLAVERPGIEVAEAQKLVCKTFWSCTYMQIPSILIGNEQQFTGWMSVIHTMVMQPVPMVGVAICSHQCMLVV